MPDLTNNEIAAIHAKVDAEMEKNGIPTDAELMAEIDAMNSGTTRKSQFEESLGV